MMSFNRRWLPVLLLSGLFLLLASCRSGPEVDTGGQSSGQDGPSMSDIKAEDVRDAVPRKEPRASYGNHSPYEVFGKKYYVMNSSAGYRERGTASWYGSKFHGRRTSSGEPYDMHLPTAAHKALPLPTYAEVTNLDNGKKVVVKINDRGPFKDDRIIDMSYAAALRLGMIGTGTARVEVRAINTDDMPVATAHELRVASGDMDEEVFLQIGAYTQSSGAEELAGKLEGVDLKPVSIHRGNNMFKVWIGPYGSGREADAVIQRAIELGFERPHRVKP